MACSKGLNQRLIEDRISQLPDPLICQILSLLPTKDSVKTSVLSTRWTSLWLSVPRLDLNCGIFQDLNALKSFGDRFFDSNRVSCIDKVKLIIHGVNDAASSYLTAWIDAAVKRNIQHLDVLFARIIWYEMPLSLYTSATLVSLKLYFLKLEDIEFVSLPCLKTMHLKYIQYGKEAVFERLVSCCPVLEELKISSGYVYGTGNAQVFRVLSTSLKKLGVKIRKNLLKSGLGFVIDAPGLCFLSINDKLTESFIINNMDSNAKLDISLPFGLDVFDETSILSRRSSIRSFLRGILKVRDMTMCIDTCKLICQYSKIEQLPQFGCLSRLRVTFCVSDMKWLPTFLESCPNLKSLILVWDTNSKEMHSQDLHRFILTSVPECLLSSLEFVDIKTGISGHYKELMLVSYFLEKSTILKKLTLRLNYFCTNEKYIVRQIMGSPRRSSTCKVVIY